MVDRNQGGKEGGSRWAQPSKAGLTRFLWLGPTSESLSSSQQGTTTWGLSNTFHTQTKACHN